MSRNGTCNSFQRCETETLTSSVYVLLTLFQQPRHATTEQWRILQQPPHEGEDGTAAPMKTRLRRHTEQEREREIRARPSVEETRSAPTSPLDAVSPIGVFPYPKPSQWSVDQVSSFISNLPGNKNV